MGTDQTFSGLIARAKAGKLTERELWALLLSEATVLLRTLINAGNAVDKNVVLRDALDKELTHWKAMVEYAELFLAGIVAMSDRARAAQNKETPRTGQDLTGSATDTEAQRRDVK